MILPQETASSPAGHERAKSPSGTIHIIRRPISYAEAWDLQSGLHEERATDRRPDTVLILEHLPVYTLGRSTRVSHWGGDTEALRSHGADLHSVNRGGSVTYHGPGQIVMYPILRLTQHAAGPRQFVWLLEEVMIRLLKQWGIEGRRIERKPGVWVLLGAEPLKIAAVGVRVERGITLHGCALNVDMDLSPFQLIQPCGDAHGRVTTMAASTGRTASLQDIKQALARHFNEVFSVEWPTTPADHVDRSTFYPSRPHAGT